MSLSDEGIGEYEQEVDGELNVVEFDEQMYSESKVKESIKEIKKITESFVHGDNPPRFSIDEDNIDEYFEEIDKVFGVRLSKLKRNGGEKHE